MTTPSHFYFLFRLRRRRRWLRLRRSRTRRFSANDRTFRRSLGLLRSPPGSRPAAPSRRWLAASGPWRVRRAGRPGRRGAAGRETGSRRAERHRAALTRRRIRRACKSLTSLGDVRSLSAALTDWRRVAASARRNRKDEFLRMCSSCAACLPTQDDVTDCRLDECRHNEQSPTQSQPLTSPKYYTISYYL